MRRARSVDVDRKPAFGIDIHLAADGVARKIASPYGEVGLFAGRVAEGHRARIEVHVQHPASGARISGQVP